jgi:hypothetical protein
VIFPYKVAAFAGSAHELSISVFGEVSVVWRFE